MAHVWHKQLICATLHHHSLAAPHNFPACPVRPSYLPLRQESVDVFTRKSSQSQTLQRSFLSRKILASLGANACPAPPRPLIWREIPNGRMGKYKIFPTSLAIISSYPHQSSTLLSLLHPSLLIVGFAILGMYPSSTPYSSPPIPFISPLRPVGSRRHGAPPQSRRQER